jgi:hypothetical protein
VLPRPVEEAPTDAAVTRASSEAALSTVLSASLSGQLPEQPQLADVPGGEALLGAQRQTSGPETPHGSRWA